MKRITSAILSLFLALAAMISISIPAHASDGQYNPYAMKDGFYAVSETFPQLYSVEETHFTPAGDSIESVSTIYDGTQPCYSLNDIAKIMETSDPNLWYLADWQRFWPGSDYPPFPPCQ